MEEKIVSWVFLGVGLLCFVMAFVNLYSDIVFFKKAIAVPGVVVRYDQENNGEEVISYSFDGEERKVTIKAPSNKPLEGDIGKVYKVLVNPDNTKDTRVQSFGKTLLGFFILLMVSAFFLLFFCIFSPYAHKLFAALLSRHPINVDQAAVFAISNPGLARWLIKGVYAATMLAVFAIPMALLGGGSWLLYRHVTFFKEAVMVTGTIVDYNTYVDRSKKEDGRKRSTVMYTPVVAYTFNGEKHTIISSWASSKTPADKDCQVGVNPQNPWEARIYSKVDLFLAIGLLCGGLLLLVLVFKLFL